MRTKLLLGALLLLTAAMLTGCGTEVPDITGMTAAEATASLTAVGLELAEPTYENKLSSDHGLIVSQKPTPGERLKEGMVAVVLAGFPPMSAPTVVGLPRAEAESVITSAGLTAGDVSEAYDQTVPNGNVISQDPLGGTGVQKGDGVVLVVSKGREPVEVPSSIGMLQQEATTLLESAGFGVETKTEDSSKEKGTVLSQTPSDGKAVPGTTVVLTLSSGVQMTKVPNVKTMFFSDAEATLKRQGFRFKTIGVYAGDGGLTTDGTIYKQSPGAGSSVPKGSLVTIWYGYESS